MSTETLPPDCLSQIDYKYWFFTRMELFFEIVAKDVEWLAKVAHLDKVPKGCPIYLPGDRANYIYILKQGRVRISRISAEGKQMTLALLEAPTLFGELALIEDGVPQESFAETLEDSYICRIAKLDFEAFLARHPKVNLRVMKLVGVRLRQIENKLEDLVFMSVEQRLQKLLLKLAAEYGRQTLEGTLIGLRITHEELGHLIHATRPTVTELLRKFEHQRLIKVIKRKIVILPSLLDAA
jgi:CRP/FNR family transcriptional regulator, cyclic AMP receptor protein